MLRRPPRTTLDRSSAASDVYKRQNTGHVEESGFLIDPRAVARWTANGPEALVSDPFWIPSKTVTTYNSKGLPLETLDAEGVPAFIRLNAANGRKLGGGARVAKLVIHDNWGRMQRDGDLSLIHI